MRRPEPQSKTRAGRWLRRIVAVLAVGSLALGALFLSSWFHERREVADDIAVAHQPVREGTPEVRVAVDPRMRVYMAHSIAFNPVREVAFGRDTALFTAGPSKRKPEDVFGGIVRAWNPEADPAALRDALLYGPAAISLLRMHVTTGLFPGGAFLVRLSPDPNSFASGRLRLEPGGVMLAYERGETWEYVVMYFPKGIDIEAFTAQNAPPPGALAALGPEAERSLEPAMALGDPDHASGASTVLCRSIGPAGPAVDRVAAAMRKAGWKDVMAGRPEAGSEDEESIRVLRGPGCTVWLSTTDPRQDGGLVTVTIGAM